MKKLKGLTLIEVIISIAILGIILIVAITTFSNAYIWINQSGDRTEKIFNEQEEMELMVEQRRGNTFLEIVLSFLGHSEIKMRGALLSTDNFNTFLSKVPAISKIDLTSESHLYGQSPDSLKITIDTINIPKGSDILVELLNQNDESLKKPIKVQMKLDSTTLNQENEEIGKMDIELDLPSDYDKQIVPGIYNISISPLKDGNLLLSKPYQKNYIVYPVAAVAVGNNGIILNSGDGKTWYTLKNSSITSNLKSIIYNGKMDKKMYLAVGENGAVIKSNDGLNWIKDFSFPNDISINKIIYTDFESDSYIGVGKNNSKGVIVLSNDGINWSVNEIEGTTNIIDISWNSILKSAGIVSEGPTTIGILENIENNWIYLPENNLTNNFDNVTSNEFEDLFILTRVNSINSINRTEIIRYSKDSESKYSFYPEEIAENETIEKTLDMIYFSNSFILIDNNGNFYKRTKSESQPVWEKAIEIPKIQTSNDTSVELKSVGGTLFVSVSDNIYRLVQDEADKKFKWESIVLYPYNPTEQINSIAGE